LLVNATSVGWADAQLPCDPHTFDVLADGALAYDLTYRQTPFLSAAGAAGVEPLDGLAMLVHQGARSFELWTGRDAPVDVMWEAALRARG
jgi:shikimate 5-dehydrogenase